MAQPLGIADTLEVRAAIACMQAFLEDQLAQGEIKTVTKLGEALFAFCAQSSYARTIFVRDGIDLFDAMLSDHERLPEKFRTVRFPQMREHLARGRAARSQHAKPPGAQYEVTFVGVRDQAPFLRLRAADGAEVEVPHPGGVGMARGSRVEFDEHGGLRVLRRSRHRDFER
jgi:hypothetical protein